MVPSDTSPFCLMAQEGMYAILGCNNRMYANLLETRTSGTRCTNKEHMNATPLGALNIVVSLFRKHLEEPRHLHMTMCLPIFIESFRAVVSPQILFYSSRLKKERQRKREERKGKRVEGKEDCSRSPPPFLMTTNQKIANNSRDWQLACCIAHPLPFYPLFSPFHLENVPKKIPLEHVRVGRSHA